MAEGADGAERAGGADRAIWRYGASEQKVGWMDGLDGYPLDRYDYWSTCGANNSIG